MPINQVNAVICSASRSKVYNIITNSELWPELFEPCISVKSLKKFNNSEHIEITAMVNGMEMTWESKRQFNSELFSVTSQLVKPMRYIKKMTTGWKVIEINSNKSLLILEHHYEVIDKIEGDDPEVKSYQDAVRFMRNAIDNNSHLELNNIKTAVENNTTESGVDSFDEFFNYVICNVKREKAYALLKDIRRWPEFLEFCVSAEIIKKENNREYFKIVGLIGGIEQSWVTTRIYNDKLHKIDFYVDSPLSEIKKINGQWFVHELDDDNCVIFVTRTINYSDSIFIKDDVKNAVQNNAKLELELMKKYLES